MNKVDMLTRMKNFRVFQTTASGTIFRSRYVRATTPEAALNKTRRAPRGWHYENVSVKRAEFVVQLFDQQAYVVEEFGFVIQDNG